MRSYSCNPAQVVWFDDSENGLQHLPDGIACVENLQGARDGVQSHLSDRPVRRIEHILQSCRLGPNAKDGLREVRACSALAVIDKPDRRTRGIHI